MNKIDLSKAGGFPLTTNTLGNMQEAYRMGIDALTKLGGDNYILSGCNENNNVVSDGVLVIDGEVIPFKGGVKQTSIYIKETPAQGQFEDGNLKDIYYTREARFGSSSLLWSSFTRISNLLELKTALDAQTKAFNTYTSTYKPLWNSIPDKPSVFSPSAHKTAWTDITGRPPIAPVIAMGRTQFFDPGEWSSPGQLDEHNNLLTVSFTPLISNYGENYKVLCNVVGNGLATNSSIFWNTEAYTFNSFKIRIRENWTMVQNIAFDYIIIANVIV